MTAPTRICIARLLAALENRPHHAAMGAGPCLHDVPTTAVPAPRARWRDAAGLDWIKETGNARQ